MTSPRNSGPGAATDRVVPHEAELTAQEIRNAERADIGLRLVGLIKRYSSSQDEVGCEIGRSEAIVQRVCDPKKDANLHLGDVERLLRSRSPRMRAIGVGMVEPALEAAGKQVIDRVEADASDAGYLKQLGTITKSNAALTAKMLQDIASDGIDAAEARQELVLIDQLQRDIAALRAALAQKINVISLIGGVR
jgi:hypothetical protein